MHPSRRWFASRYLLFIAAPIASVFVSLFLGRYPLTVGTVLRTIAGRFVPLDGGIPSELAELYDMLIWGIRMPRLLLGALVGGSLAVSGASFQGLFYNPLVSSGILGVSAGAGFGAALAILLFDNTAAIYLFSFGFGLLAMLLSYMIGRFYQAAPTVTLVLGGVIVSSIFSALVSLAKYAADPHTQLPAIVFWLMGSLASARYKDIAAGGIPMVLGIAGLFSLRWQINVLSMGDKEARTLGVNTSLARGLVALFATLATAGAVCVSGVIGWVGLVIPHIGRMIVGNDNRVLIPCCISLGATFLILIDDLARLISGSEIPLGILTALVGAPFFVYLLKKTKGGGF